MDVPF
jgi:hypothetical protein